MTATAHLVFNHDTCRMKLLIFIITLPLLLLASHDVEARKKDTSVSESDYHEGSKGEKRDEKG